MRRYATPVALVILTSLYAAGSTPVVDQDTINYGVNPAQITINGSGFEPKSAAPTVLFDNVSLTPLVSFTDLQIVANLPAGTQAGTYRLRVTNSQGNLYEFASLARRPVIGVGPVRLSKHIQSLIKSRRIGEVK